MIMNQFIQFLRESRVKIKFGLRQQGHLDKVRHLLEEGKTWEEIGKEIGWDGEAAKRFYESENKRPPITLEWIRNVIEAMKPVENFHGPFFTIDHMKFALEKVNDLEKEMDFYRRQLASIARVARGAGREYFAIKAEMALMDGPNLKKG